MNYELTTKSSDDIRNVDAEHRRSTPIEKLKRARKRYASSFTMHAVEHILNGTIAERMFWSLKLSAALGTALYLSQKLFTSYFDHEVDTKIDIETRDQLQFPMVLIGTPTTLFTVPTSRSNCSTNQSVSYDPVICKSLMQKCPEIFVGRVSSGNNATISCDVLGQFVVINADGKSFQTPTVASMKIWIENISSSYLPLPLLIRTPSMLPNGKVDGGSMPKAWYDFVEIDQIGHYKFSLDKTSIIRLPYPYSDPSCIEQRSDEAARKNIFKGNYTIGSCIETCKAKAELWFCNTMTTVNRYFIKDEAFLKKNFVDQPLTHVSKCLQGNKGKIGEYEKDCIGNCHNPCFEQAFKISEKYKPGQKPGTIELSFYYELRKETHIKEVPRYEVETLLSSFGGQLGLMVGMSAVSLMEVLVWFLLVLVEGWYRMRK